MLKFLILVTIMLWIHDFFGHSDRPAPHLLGSSIYFLTIVIVILIIAGFLS